MEQKLVSDLQIKRLGRQLEHNNITYLTYSGSELGFTYDGNKIIFDITSLPDYCHEADFQAWLAVFVGNNEEPWLRFPITATEAEYTVFDREKYANDMNINVCDLPKDISIRVVKLSETAFGTVGIKYVLSDDNSTFKPLPYKEKKLLFFGDSITCGYGVEGRLNVDTFTTAQENVLKAYAVQTARLLDADYHLVSWSGIGIITDFIPEEADEKDTTILAGQIYPCTDYMLCKRLGIDAKIWNVSEYNPDAIVVYLGTNDASYTKSISEREADYMTEYANYIKNIRKDYPSKPIFCCAGIQEQSLNNTIRNAVGLLKNDVDDNFYFVEFDAQTEQDGIGTDNHPSPVSHKKAAIRLSEAIKAIL